MRTRTVGCLQRLSAAVSPSDSKSSVVSTAEFLPAVNCPEISFISGFSAIVGLLGYPPVSRPLPRRSSRPNNAAVETLGYVLA